MSARSPEDRLAALGKWAAAIGFVALLLMPTPQDMSGAAQRMAAVTFLMAVLWITQAIPLAATSLIPLVAFPLLGIQPAKTVSKAYIDENVFLFLGGFIIALGIEKWGLHRRMALHIVRLLGTGLKLVVLGFMAATAFLSMWISNTASTLLMLPIGLAMVASIREVSAGADPSKTDDDPQRTLDRFATVLMISIAYAASIGGFTTLVGTPTNVTFLGIWNNQLFPETEYPDVPAFSAGEWMLAVFPLGVLLLLCAWLLLTWRLPNRVGTKPLDRGFFSRRLRELGPASSAEKRMLAVFAVTALLWIFRKPLTAGGEELLPGWGNLLAEALSGWGVTPGMIHDSTVAVGMALLMFFIPAKARIDNSLSANHSHPVSSPAGPRPRDARRTEYLMDWKTCENLPWDILLLIGGGFAIAGGFRATKLADWLGHEFAGVVADWPAWLLVAGVCLLMTFLTELTSNVATVSTLMPILAGTALRIGVDPRLIMVPAVISASCAFMLPIATPPNAIVFGSGRVRMGQMACYGIVLNLIGVVLVTAATFLLLAPQLGFELQGLPDWLSTAK